MTLRSGYGSHDQSRFGGGAPGRRRADQGWGNGSGRGSSGPAEENETNETDGLPDARGLGEGGRHGRTRTTGTAGGPKA